MNVWLLEAQTQNTVEASLLPMTRQHVSQARRVWMNGFQSRQKLFLCDDDFMVWNRGIMSDSASDTGDSPYGYVVICENEVQGVVVFDERLQPSRRRPGTQLLYLRYIATAPWNRRNGPIAPRFRHVGRILIAQAVRESIMLGCPGRIGLHSFPDAEEFYENLRFDKPDSDIPYRGMSYFELRPSAAYMLLSDFGLPSSLALKSV